MGWLIVLAAVAAFALFMSKGVTVSTGPRQPGEPLFRLTVVWPNGNVTRWPRNG